MLMSESPLATVRRQGAGVGTGVGGRVGTGLGVQVAVGGPGVTDGPAMRVGVSVAAVRGFVGGVSHARERECADQGDDSSQDADDQTGAEHLPAPPQRRLRQVGLAIAKVVVDCAQRAVVGIQDGLDLVDARAAVDAERRVPLIARLANRADPGSLTQAATSRLDSNQT